MPQVTVGDREFTYSNTDTGDKWFYHPDGTAKIGYEFDSEEYYKQGFCDSPDDFDKTEEEVVEEATDDLESWSKDMLVDYALEKFDVKLKKNYSKANLIAQVEELENGNMETGN